MKEVDMSYFESRIIPNVFNVYEKTSFKVVFNINGELTAKDYIECQLSNSFNNDKVSPSFTKQWQTEDENGDNYVAISLDNKQEQNLSFCIKKREFTGGYDCEARHGRCFIINIKKGVIKKGSEIALLFCNTYTPWLANQAGGKTENEGQVFVALNGKRIDNMPTFSVLPGQESYHRIIVPSYAKPGAKVKVKIVSLDKYSNLTTREFKNYSLYLDGKKIIDGINFRGRGEACVVFDEPGIYRLDDKQIISNPICITNSDKSLYFGDIHFHNYPSVDAMGNTPYEYAKNVSCLDFAAATEHASIGLPEHFEQVKKWYKDFLLNDDFIPILAMELAHPDVRLHTNVYFYNDDEFDIIESLTQKFGDYYYTSQVKMKDLCEYIKNREVLLQTHHTAWNFDMRIKYPDKMKLIEVFSMHGQSELYDTESPIRMQICRHRGTSRQGYIYVRDALALVFRNLQTA